MKAAVLGTTGYTGMLLLRMLAEHSEVKDIIAVSSSRTGENIDSLDPGIGNTVINKTKITNSNFVSVDECAKLKPDVVFAALPHLKSAEILTPFFGKTVIIDLSADFRIKETDLFFQAYGQNPPKPELLDQAVYGLCEVYREDIKKADLIANPGCYPTCTLLPLIPLLKSNVTEGDIIVNSISGISGAGRKANVNSLFCERAESVCAYLPGKTHRHTTEIQKEISYAEKGHELFFTPHLAPLRRGMQSSTTLKLKAGISPEKIADIYNSFYKDSPFIKLLKSGLPDSRNVMGSNRCDISWHFENDRLFIFSVIDNLVKGASGQALQNMNIRFGFNETEGLSVHGLV